MLMPGSAEAETAHSLLSLPGEPPACPEAINVLDPHISPRASAHVSDTKNGFPMTLASCRVGWNRSAHGLASQLGLSNLFPHRCAFSSSPRSLAAFPTLEQLNPAQPVERLVLARILLL
jgi:hypothetical protein